MSSEAKLKFERLILPRLDDGYRLARWLAGNQVDAEDIMQEACLRAFLAMDRFVEGNVRAWFLTIVRNASYSWIEKHRPELFVSTEQLHSQDHDLVERGGAVAEPSPNPESLLIAKEHAASLAKAIDDLPLVLREALVLREYHELSYREIADVSGAPIGTVMSRLARARQHILTVFKRDDDDA